MQKAKNPVGRPTDYNLEIAKKICDAVAITSDGLRRMCSKRDDLPHADTINEWRWKYPEFSAQYANAKRMQAEILAEEILDISDDGSSDKITKIDSNGDEYEVVNTEFTQRSRLRVDTRKWIACKLLPKIYGEPDRTKKLEDENLELRDQMRALRAELDAKNKKEY
jgi:hypothetical protein